jgi:hypothetical protein
MFPDLLSFNSKFKLYLIGPLSDKYYSKFNSHESITCLRSVKSISDSIPFGSIGLCPIRFGAGVQTKILDYMSLRLPVVTFDLSAKALNLVHNSHSLIASTDSEFVEHIKTLYSDTKLSHNISSQGYDYFSRNFSNHALNKIFNYLPL